jgi:hypothetical protein
MSQRTNHSSIQRIFLLALLATSMLAMNACSETSLNRLQAEFSIAWPGEFGYVDGDIDASRFAFGAVSTGTFKDIEVQITNPGNASLDICSIYLANATFDENGDLANETLIEIDAEIALLSAQDAPAPGPGTLAPGSAMQFLLHFSPLYGEPIADGMFVVVKHSLNWNCEIDEASGDPLFIPIVGAGEGNPVPDIYANPKLIDFGEVDVGRETDPYEITVGNAGPGLLNVAEVQLLGANPEHFTLVPGSVSSSDFETGEAGYFSVKFSPQHQGTWGAEIHIQSNDPDEQPKIIPMVGVGNPGELGKGPQAVCAADRVTTTLVNENFDGSGSYDSEGLPLTFSWSLTPPTGSAASLSNASSDVPSIFVDLAGTYRGDLTVTNTAGQSDSCTQNIESVPNENFRIELFWANPDDMDLHLVRPQGQWSAGGAAIYPNTGSEDDCHFANSNPDWSVAGYSNDNPALDLDDINGLGPENINIVDPATSPYDGWYQVFVHDYPNTQTYTPANDVTVQIYLNGTMMNSYNFQMSGEDTNYYVAKIHWPSGQIVDCNGLGGCP